MTINLVCIGKVKDQNLKNLSEEYIKRIRKFVHLNVINIENEDSFLDMTDRFDYIVVLDEKGKEKTSLEFSNFIKNHYLINKNMCFLIGNWKGINKKIENLSDLILSLSKMTFPYQFARVIFLEQLYRAFAIISGIDYHK